MGSQSYAHYCTDGWNDTPDPLTGTFIAKTKGGWTITKARAYSTKTKKWYLIKSGSKLKEGTTDLEIKLKNQKYNLKRTVSLTYEDWE